MKHSLFLMLALAPTPLFAQSAIGVGGAFFFEDSDLSGEQQASVQTTDESFSYESDDFFNASLYYLTNMSPSVRVGGGLTYFGSHTAAIPREDEEEFDYFEFGHLIEVLARAEFLIPITEKIDLMPGALAGVPVLFPGGDFQDEIDELSDQQASVWDLPRVGFTVGPLLSARYKYHDRLYFRADIAIKWEKLFLFNTTEDVQGVPFRKDWSTSTVRTEFGLAIEVDLAK